MPALNSRPWFRLQQLRIRYEHPLRTLTLTCVRMFGWLASLVVHLLSSLRYSKHFLDGECWLILPPQTIGLQNLRAPTHHLTPSFLVQTSEGIPLSPFKEEIRLCYQNCEHSHFLKYLNLRTKMILAAKLKSVIFGTILHICSFTSNQKLQFFANFSDIWIFMPNIQNGYILNGYVRKRENFFKQSSTSQKSTRIYLGNERSEFP